MSERYIKRLEERVDQYRDCISKLKQENAKLRGQLEDAQEELDVLRSPPLKGLTINKRSQK